MSKIINNFLVAFVIGVFMGSPNLYAVEGKGETNKSLMAKCEAAVQERLEPMRNKRIDECVAKKEKKDRAACERYYKDFAHREVSRLQLYREVPECVEAEKAKEAKKK